MPEILTKIKDALPLNWALLGNPVNWIIVFLMIAIAGAGIAFISVNAASDDSASE